MTAPWLITENRFHRRPADPSLEKTISDLKIKKLDHALSALDATAPDYNESAPRSKRNVINTSWKNASDEPKNIQTIYKSVLNWGSFISKLEKSAKPIQELQKAQNNPHRKLQAMGLFGQCFAKRGMNDMAARKLQDALKEKLTFDEEKKGSHLRAGSVLEKMGKADEAIEQSNRFTKWISATKM